MHECSMIAGSTVSSAIDKYLHLNPFWEINNIVNQGSQSRAELYTDISRLWKARKLTLTQNLSVEMALHRLSDSLKQPREDRGGSDAKKTVIGTLVERTEEEYLQEYLSTLKIKASEWFEHSQDERATQSRKVQETVSWILDDISLLQSCLIDTKQNETLSKPSHLFLYILTTAGLKT